MGEDCTGRGGSVESGRTLHDCGVAKRPVIREKEGVIKFVLLGVLLWVGAPVFADDFKVDSVIHPVVAKLPKPKLIEEFGKEGMAISTSSDEAAKHVAQGIARLNASWDFEAYRHFTTAAKLDPDCLMAYWGIAMSLAGSQHEFFDERQNSVDRMLDLLEAEVAAKEDRWSALEKRYAQAAGFIFTSGVRAGGETFRAIAMNYPEDIQSQLLSMFLLRDGFDMAGKPMTGQRRANEGLKKIYEAHPDNVSVRAFWVSSQSEAPLNAPFLRENVLPVARKLVADFPDYPPFSLMQAHVEARCGNAAMGIQAAEKATALFEAYMKEEGVSIYDCEGWVLSQVYLVNLHQAKGDHAKAMEVAKKLAKVEILEERVFSRGAGLLLWEGRTAGARAVMSESDQALLDAGQKSLELLPEEQWFKERSFALQYRDCLAFYLAVRKAIVAKDLKTGKSLFDGFLARVQALSERRELASKTSTYGSWVRAMNAMSIMVSELRGLLSEMEEGAIKLSATTWYQSAMDRQGRPANLIPPVIDYPLELRLGEFYFSQGKFEKAKEAYEEGLALRPNHLRVLKGYYQTLVKLEQKEAAEVLAKRIKMVEQ